MIRKVGSNLYMESYMVLLLYAITAAPWVLNHVRKFIARHFDTNTKKSVKDKGCDNAR